MIDQTIKRAVLISFLVVMTAKFTSTLYDHWMADTQNLMIENQIALDNHQQGLASQQNEAEWKIGLADRCEKALREKICALPKDFEELGECIVRLNAGRCDELPFIHLCAAVEELELCSDPFEDQQQNGCDRLRSRAECKKKPAPEVHERRWRVRFDDGMWQGD